MSATYIRWRMRWTVRRLGPAWLALVALTACQSMPDDYMNPDPRSARWRAAESRQLRAATADQALDACSGALQDMGFTIERTHSEIGLLTASKRGSAVNPAQVAGYIALGILFGSEPPAWDDEQEVRASLLLTPDPEGGRSAFRARLSIQRQVFDTNGLATAAEPIHDPEIFKAFFARLDASLFFEEQQL